MQSVRTETASRLRLPCLTEAVCSRPAWCLRMQRGEYKGAQPAHEELISRFLVHLWSISGPSLNSHAGYRPGSPVHLDASHPLEHRRWSMGRFVVLARGKARVRLLGWAQVRRRLPLDAAEAILVGR